MTGKEKNCRDEKEKPALKNREKTADDPEDQENGSQHKSKNQNPHGFQNP